MEDTLITLLESFGYPVYRQGSLTENTPYPPTFITFWNPDSPDHNHYDNRNYGTAWAFNVYVYSNDLATPYTLLTQIRTLLKSENWVVPSCGFDVISDEPTHTGRGVDIYYLEV